MYQNIKRLFDFILSLLGLIILSPVFLVLIVAIKLDSPGPVLFKQKRVGIHKTHFRILKFRTMRIDTPKDMPTHLLKNPEQYITKTGKFLRKTSLDELPQILNILKGDMAIVGPRPALWNQYDLIAERDKYGANDVRPGLTGWAQINGRDELETVWWKAEPEPCSSPAPCSSRRLCSNPVLIRQGRKRNEADSDHRSRKLYRYRRRALSSGIQCCSRQRNVPHRYYFSIGGILEKLRLCAL